MSRPSLATLLSLALNPPSPLDAELALAVQVATHARPWRQARPRSRHTARVPLVTRAKCRPDDQARKRQRRLLQHCRCQPETFLPIPGTATMIAYWNTPLWRIGTKLGTARFQFMGQGVTPEAALAHLEQQMAAARAEQAEA